MNSGGGKKKIHVWKFCFCSVSESVGLSMFFITCFFIELFLLGSTTAETEENGREAIFSCQKPRASQVSLNGDVCNTQLEM